MKLVLEQREQSYAAIADGIREFNAKLLDIAQANTMAGMNFVSELTRVKGRTEAFELWSRHAQSHLRLAELLTPEFRSPLIIG